jgi:cyclopropane fatty-acyl-phospholipid synthase-like methyltransferase
MIADVWHTMRMKSKVSNLVFDVAQLVQPNGKILDIGCGTGYPNAHFFAQNGFDVMGIDFSENMLNFAKQAGIPNAKFELIDFFEFEPVDMYDGIVAYDSFFHFDLCDQASIYPRVASWMNPGAVLFFTHGKQKSVKEGEMFGQNFYYSCLDVSELCVIMNQSHLEIIKIIENYVEDDMDRDLVVFARKIST